MGNGGETGFGRRSRIHDPRGSLPRLESPAWEGGSSEVPPRKTCRIYLIHNDEQLHRRYGVQLVCFGPWFFVLGKATQSPSSLSLLEIYTDARLGAQRPCILGYYPHKESLSPLQNRNENIPAVPPQSTLYKCPFSHIRYQTVSQPAM